MASPTKNSSKQYPKRTGTTSILGPLYETKLLSLIYFRAIHNKTIEEFYIGTNVDKLGSFDDICFKAKLKGVNKPVVVFLQAKHRENANSVFTLNESDLTDYFYSYLDIREQFKPESTDVLFNGNFDESDCLFVLYTTAKGEKRNIKYESSLANDLNALIGTGAPGSQPPPDDKDKEFLFKIIIRDQMKRLARQMAKCIFGEYGDIQMLMQDELVLQYHVILGQEVFTISEIQPEGQRLASLRYVLSDEISSENEDDFIQIFKNNLYTEICKRKVSPPQIFNVPASFGNKDLTIKGSDKKIERKLIDLESKIIKLIEESKPSKTVNIDESMGKGFLQLSGGIASAVGNLLILDEASNLFKINDNFESLGNLSKKLYLKLKEKIDDLNEYKLDVKVKIFPKLSFAADENLSNVVSDFLSTLLFYTSQKNEKEVEETLISEITYSHGDEAEHVEVTSDAIFLKYHDEIQKWSLKSEKGMGTYLDKEGSLYKKSVKHAARQPLTTVMHMMYKKKNENYTFRKEALNSIKFNDLLPGTVIVTDNSALTYAKLIKHIINTVILDFEYILKLSPRDQKALREELINMNEAKVLIAVFINAQNIDTSYSTRLEYITNSMMNKKVIILSDRNSVEKARTYFSTTIIIIDKIKLTDLSKKSQKRILENTRLLFQDNEINAYRFFCTHRILKQITKYIGGAVINGMMHGTRRVIGKPFNNSNCKLYVQRNFLFHGELSEIIPDDRSYFYSKYDKFTIIRGDPGFAKPVVVARLLRIFMRENYQWLLRFDLLDYTKQFNEWKVKKKTIGSLQLLIYFCKVALSEESSKVLTDDLIIKLGECIEKGVHLKDWSGVDEWTVFELALFLNFFRLKRIHFFIDGFNEVTPTYADEVLALQSVINKFNRARTLWISTQWYDRQDLKECFNFDIVKFYQLCPLNYHDEILNLELFQDKKEKLEDLEFKNIFDFIAFMTRSNLSKLIIINKLLDEPTIMRSPPRLGVLN